MLTAGDQPFLMFLALVALFSPLAALSAFLPIAGALKPADQVKLALGLFFNVLVFVLVAIFVGEPLLNFLGVSTAALTVTGGIALLYAGVPMMRGIEESGADAPVAEDAAAGEGAWRRQLFTPVSFPMVVGGTSFGMIVAFSASASTLFDRLAFTLAGIGWGAVAALTLYLAGHVHRRASPRARSVLARVAGILLTAIAVMLLARGGTELVVDALKVLRP